MQLSAVQRKIARQASKGGQMDRRTKGNGSSPGITCPEPQQATSRATWQGTGLCCEPGGVIHCRDSLCWRHRCQDSFSARLARSCWQGLGHCALLPTCMWASQAPKPEGAAALHHPSLCPAVPACTSPQHSCLKPHSAGGVLPWV